MSQILSRSDALSGIATVAAASPVALPALAAGGAGQDIELRRLWVRYCKQEAAHIVAGEKMSPVRAEMGEDDDRGLDAWHLRFWATWGEDGDDEHSDNEDDEDEDDNEDGDDEDEDDEYDDNEDDEDEDDDDDA
jgi:hypothetical protein